MMFKVILLSGYKRAGKDYVAQKLQEQIEGSTILALATPLKDIIATTMSLSKERLDKYKNVDESLFIQVDGFDDGMEITDFRTILQRFGSEAMKKHFGDDVWVDLLIKNLPSEGVVIVSDWRFLSEYKALSKIAEVTTVRIDDFNLTGDGHISEHDLDYFIFDQRFDNTNKDSTIDGSIRLLCSRYK